MSRLWVRISLVIGSVVTFVALAPFLLRRLWIPVFGDQFDNLRQSLPEFYESLPPETQHQLREAIMADALASMASFIIFGAIAAWVAGVWLSRRITAPLGRLEQGAQAIAGQDLSYRVPVQGSVELVAVATAFNQMAAQLETAESLRKNLLTDVAHELRHPIHILQGNLQAILDDVYPMSKEEITRLLNQTQHLTTLVNDLHELAQAEAHQLPLQRQPTDMAMLVKETAVAFAPTAKTKGVSVHTELLGTIPVLSVDAARMRQVLNNLLGNALAHTPGDGHIRVSLEQIAAELQLRVHDDGQGIEPPHLPHLFDRFYRGDSARRRNEGGVGLGLAIAKAIVEEHGGRITAVSPGKNQGSTFTVCLPNQN